MHKHIEHFFSEELTERAALLAQAREDAETENDLICLQNLSALLQLAPRPEDAHQAKRSYDAFIRERRRESRKRMYLKVFSSAAVIALLVASAWITASVYFQRNAHAINTLHVPAGQRAGLTLSDGSEVWLNGGSTFSYPSGFSARERRVTLEGEAGFDVKGDPSRPFIVSTGAVEVKVSGTKFDVFGYSLAGYLSVSLFEGSVKVYEPCREPDGVLLKPNERLYFKNGKMTVAPIGQATDVSLMKNGIYSFENEPFSAILQKLELYYGQTIQVQDSSILAFEYTAKFRHEDGVEEILRQIGKTQKFTIEKDRKLNKIILRK